MDGLKTILKVSRPAGWSFGPILYLIGLIHSPARLLVLRRTPAVLQLASLSFPLALVVFGVNDVYDYESDIRNPRKSADGLEGTILHPSYRMLVLLSASLATAIILLTSHLTGRPHNVLVVLMLLILSWQYSAPPLRLKERPVFDSLSNGAIVDLVYLAGYTAGGGPLGLRILTLKGHVLALCTAGVHALGAAVDATADAAVGQRTIATAFGPRSAIGFGVLNYALAFLIERELTVFGIYILGGLLITTSSLIDIALAHLAFRFIVYWTVAMSVVWFADKARVGNRSIYQKRVSEYITLMP